MIVHVQQPPRSRLCGQAVVAMVLGVSLDEAVARIGHRHGTRTRELVAALGPRALAPRLRRRVPHAGIAKVAWERGSHWVLGVGTTIHDPELPGPVEAEAWFAAFGHAGRMTSHLPVNIRQRQRPT